MKNLILRLAVRLFQSLQQKVRNETYLSYRMKYSIAKSFRFNGDGILLYGDGQIHLGEKSYIGRQSSIQAVQGHNVTIGDFCAISHYVKIYTSSYVSDQDFQTDNRLVKCGSVSIGNGVWIGANVLINPGISIGSNSIIGANSVVTKNVEANTIVGGNPAVFIRYKTLNDRS